MSKAASAARHIPCFVCKHAKRPHDVLPGRLVREPIFEKIALENPGWSEDAYICFEDLNRYRTAYIESALQAEKGILTRLEKDVMKSMDDYNLVSENLNSEFDEKLSLGQRLADGVASFGGSWGFISSFALVLAGWIVLNTWVLARGQAFDPYPYILLNLVLSCLAAIQAPIIMMSQNRQEARDRLRSENDYRVNLKAELEIRHLNAKMDLLLTTLWQQLMDIQNVQMDLMQELSAQKRGHS